MMQETDRVDADYGIAMLVAQVTVRHDGLRYHCDFLGTGFDGEGNINVVGRRNRTVQFELEVEAGKGVASVEFAADPSVALRVGDDASCPPRTDNPQFDRKSVHPSPSTRKRTRLRFRDKMQTAGEFAYALTFDVQREGGKPEQETHDPVVANRPF